MKDEERSKVLLRAAYDLINRNDSSHYAEKASSTYVRYDDADCDGYCLMEDIATHIGLEARTQPIPLADEKEEQE